MVPGGMDSNLRPAAYEAAALPLSYAGTSAAPEGDEIRPSLFAS